MSSTRHESASTTTYVRCATWIHVHGDSYALDHCTNTTGRHAYMQQYYTNNKWSRVRTVSCCWERAPPKSAPEPDGCGSCFGVALAKQSPQWIESLAVRVPKLLRGADCCGCTRASQSPRASKSAPPHPAQKTRITQATKLINSTHTTLYRDNVRMYQFLFPIGNLQQKCS